MCSFNTWTVLPKGARNGNVAVIALILVRSILAIMPERAEKSEVSFFLLLLLPTFITNCCSEILNKF